MGIINIIAVEQLQDASSVEEALLCQVIEKIVAVEALGMQKLSQKLPSAVMHNLQERIFILKESAARSAADDKILSFPLSFLQQDPASALDQKISGINPLTLDCGILNEQPSDATKETLALINLEGASRDLIPSSRKSLFSRAKALLGFSPSDEDSPKNPYPTLSFNQRGKTAGSAYLQRWEIRLNPILLAENSEIFIKEVIPHEYAHLLTFALYGKVQPHGREWQMMMTEIMGLPANRTHFFNTDNSVTRRYERFTYTCLCQTHELTSIRHNRVQSRKARYFCKHCGESLELQE